MFYILNILAIIFNTVPRWVFCGDAHIPDAVAWEYGDLLMKYQAASFVLIAASCYFFDVRNKSKVYVLLGTVLLTFGNAYDEIFGNPYVFDDWEKVYGAGVLQTVIVLLIKHHKTKTTIP